MRGLVLRRLGIGSLGVVAPVLRAATSRVPLLHVCGHSPPAASRRLLAYDIPVYVFFFLISAPPVVVAFGHPLPFIPWRFWPIFSMTRLV